MAKSGRLTPLVSLTLLFLISCSNLPRYSRHDLGRQIESICQKEFNLKVVVRESGDTVWIYAPLEFTDEKGQWRISASGQWEDDIRDALLNITQVIRNVMLELESPPSFYCFVASNIKSRGMDLYSVVFLPDELRELIEREMLEFTLGEERKSTVSMRILTPQTLGDASGEHIQAYDIPIEEFVLLLIAQDIIDFHGTKVSPPGFILDGLDVGFSPESIILDLTLQAEGKGSIGAYAEAIEQRVKKICNNYTAFLGPIAVTIQENTYGIRRDFSLTGNLAQSMAKSSSSQAPEYRLLGLQKANFYTQRAEAYYHDAQYPQARALFEKALAAQPT